MEAALQLLRPRIRRWAAGYERVCNRAVVDAEDLRNVGEFAAWRLLEAAGPADVDAPSKALLKARSAMRDQLRLVDSLSRGMRAAARAGAYEEPRVVSLAGDGRRAALEVEDRFGADPAELASAADLWRWVKHVAGPRRGRALEMRFRLGRGSAEVAEEMGLSCRAVQQLVDQGLQTLRRLRAGIGEEA